MEQEDEENNKRKRLNLWGLLEESVAWRSSSSLSNFWRNTAMSSCVSWWWIDYICASMNNEFVCPLVSLLDHTNPQPPVFTTSMICCPFPPCATGVIFFSFIFFCFFWFGLFFVCWSRFWMVHFVTKKDAGETQT